MTNRMPTKVQGSLGTFKADEATKTPSSETQASVTLEDTLLGTDPPIEEAHPGLQPALVFASYPLALIVLVSIVAIYFAFFRSAPSKIDDRPVPAVMAE
jgi:hypothetical protein